MALTTPMTETFTKHNLNDKSNDDWYIASALELLQTDKDVKIVMLSNDTAMRLRASCYSIVTIQLPDEYRLPPSGDRLLKANTKLKEELDKLLHKQPRPLMRFKGKSDRLTLCIKEAHQKSVDGSNLCPQSNLESGNAGQAEESVESRNEATGLTTERDAEKIREQVKLISDLQKQIAPTLEKMKPMLEEMKQLHEIPPEEEERYRLQTAKYHGDVQTYKRTYEDVSKRIGRIITLNLELFNEGGSVAEDMRISIELPSHIAWHGTDGRELLPAKPTPPPPPRSKLELQRVEMYSQLNELYYPGSTVPFDRLYSHDELVHQPNVKIEDCAEQLLEIRIVRCFHNSSVSIPELYAEFIDDRELTTFPLKCKTKELNTPEVVEDTLLVIIEHETSIT